MNKIVVINIVTFITFLLTIYANTIINRRKVLKFWIFINCIDCIAWTFLGSIHGSLVCLYPAIRHSYIIWKYKEEKIIVSFKDSLITSIPYLLIGLIELRNGISWLAFFGIINFINSMSYMIKKDSDRQILEGSLDIYYLFYGLAYQNYGEVIRNIVEIIIFAVNIIRLKINGESKYYKDKRNVILDE